VRLLHGELLGDASLLGLGDGIALGLGDLSSLGLDSALLNSNGFVGGGLVSNGLGLSLGIGSDLGDVSGVLGLEGGVVSGGLVLSGLGGSLVRNGGLGMLVVVL
jgi:hypothetical protein